ncbi:apolipoprotein L domain-containing protein 1 [Thamnophis elegans]|uniref:apolipoprotein L domain-containing protein 1 n=1 Tax=Thamnophis elegans TaxID=35005 RepID=UPI00137693D1|nr:apolipoprotein L domain-containing protein 1 [Thamnophis elegans]
MMIMEYDVFSFSFDPTYRFYNTLLDQQSQLCNHIKKLQKILQRLSKLNRCSVIAHLTGNSLSAAGAIMAIVGLSLSPATLGASLLASGVGLGVAAAGGAVSITSDLSLVFCNSKEVKRAKKIALACHNQMKEIMNCLEFLHRSWNPTDPFLLQTEKNACIALYNSTCFLVFCGPQGFLLPEHTEEVTKVSHILLKAKIQKLAENLEVCARHMDEICKLLESRKACSWRTKGLV